MNKLRRYTLLLAWLIFVAGLLGVFLYMNKGRETPSALQIERENNVIIILLSAIVILSTLLNLTSVYRSFTEKLRFISVIRIVFANTILLFFQCICILGIFILSALI